MPPSRLKANIILEFDVIENKPQCQTHTMMSVKRAIAPSSPNTSRKICNTGCPALTVLSKS